MLLLPSADTPRHILFTYGTMMTGNRNRNRIHGSIYLGRAVTTPRYSLYCMGYAPGMIHKGKDSVHGECYVLDDMTMDTVDAAEGAPWKYQKQYIHVTLEDGTRVQAWAYMLHPTWLDRDSVYIEDGKWVQPADSMTHWRKKSVSTKARRLRGGSVKGRTGDSRGVREVSVGGGAYYLDHDYDIEGIAMDHGLTLQEAVAWVEYAERGHGSNDVPPLDLSWYASDPHDWDDVEWTDEADYDRDIDDALTMRCPLCSMVLHDDVNADDACGGCGSILDAGALDRLSRERDETLARIAGVDDEDMDDYLWDLHEPNILGTTHPDPTESMFKDALARAATQTE